MRRSTGSLKAAINLARSTILKKSLRDHLSEPDYPSRKLSRRVTRETVTQPRQMEVLSLLWNANLSWFSSLWSSISRVAEGETAEVATEREKHTCFRLAIFRARFIAGRLAVGPDGHGATGERRGARPSHFFKNSLRRPVECGLG